MSQQTRSASDRRLGTELAHAIAAQDTGALRELIATPVTFRAVTPSRFWEATTAEGVTDVVLGVWFGSHKRVTQITSLATGAVGGVQKVSYRLSVELPSGPSVVEQVAYYTEADGQIVDLRLVCSGFRPV